MTEPSPNAVEIQPARKNRWLRRELWFVVLAAIVVFFVALSVHHRDPPREAKGQPMGVVPNPPEH